MVTFKRSSSVPTASYAIERPMPPYPMALKVLSPKDLVWKDIFAKSTRTECWETGCFVERSCSMQHQQVTPAFIPLPHRGVVIGRLTGGYMCKATRPTPPRFVHSA